MTDHYDLKRLYVIMQIIFHSLNLQQDIKDNKMLRLIISLTLLSLSLANIVKRSEYILFSPHA